MISEVGYFKRRGSKRGFVKGNKKSFTTVPKAFKRAKSV